MSAQSMQALAVANEIRTAGLRWRREVASQDAVSSRETLARTLEAGDFSLEVGALRLVAFLTAASRIGEYKARKMIGEAGILRRDLRVRDLTERERGALAVALRRRAAETRGRRLR